MHGLVIENEKNCGYDILLVGIRLEHLFLHCCHPVQLFGQYAHDVIAQLEKARIQLAFIAEPCNVI